MAFVGLSSIGYALHLTLNRKVLLEDRADPFWLTLIPMAIGGSILLAAGLMFEERPILSAGLVGIVLCLGIVNGAAAFLLWTWSQRFLAAADNSLINNLMLVEIALLEVLLFGQIFDAYQWVAIAVVLGAITVVQLRRR
nr:DMT family transporter [Saccharibacillus sacchari]